MLLQRGSRLLWGSRFLPAAVHLNALLRLPQIFSLARFCHRRALLGIAQQNPAASTKLHSQRLCGCSLFSSSSDSSSERARSALDRASKYKERKDAGLDTAEEDFAMPFLPHSPADHIERQIQASIQRGELDNLKGKGQPLPETHDAQFFRVDPLMSALARSLGAQNIRPESIDARDAFRAQLAAFEVKVKEAVASGRGGTGMKLERLRAGLHPGVQFHWQELQKLHRAFNDAVLKDKELYGAAWPLNPYPKLDFIKELDRIVSDSV